MMFGRKKKADRETDVTEAAEQPQDSAADVAEGAEARPDPETTIAKGDGPRDVADVTDTEGLADLGALRIAPPSGMELRLEIDQGSNEVTAVQVADDHGSVQLQCFAAPRSSGIWEDIREEISGMIDRGGGTVQEVDGPFGTELRTRLAQAGPQGRTIFAPAVFAGVDGPRWFLRAVYSGSAAVDEERRGAFDEVVRSVVVVRGEEPRAPREMLPLRMPEQNQPAPQESGEEELKPFERGPEITEVR